MAKFVVMTLPRSRSAWMAEFLSYDGRVVGHDLTVECSSLQDFEDALEGVDGTVETGAVLGWQLLRSRHPSLRIATVERPLWDINASFAKLGVLGVDWDEMTARSLMLQALASQPGVLALHFDHLASEAGCHALFDHCLEGEAWDWRWWSDLAGKNIQINLPARLEKLRQNAPGLADLRAELVAEIAKLGGAPCQN